MNPPKDLSDACPSDVRMFLVFKEKDGKTKVHRSGCAFMSKRQQNSKCDCPVRRSAGSVDSLIGQVRAIFRDFGRGSDWNAVFGIGNPAAAPIIKRYLAAIRLEQSVSATTPRRAPPLFRDKLYKILRHITYKLTNPNLSMIYRYISFRDRAFLNLLSYTGDRAGDLGTLLLDQIFAIPNNEGIILNLCTGKTADIHDPRVVVVLKCDSLEFCPVNDLRKYLEFCKENGFVLTGGYVFRPIDAHSTISDKPLTSSTVNGRLKSYLCKLNLWEGETPHSTRGGCALTLAWMGIDQESIKQHVGWKSDTMFHHYTVGNDMCSRYASAKALSVVQSKTPRQKIYEHCKGYLNFKKFSEC